VMAVGDDRDAMAGKRIRGRVGEGEREGGWSNETYRI